MKKIVVEAHRGYSAKYPENTIAAYEAAVELGVDSVEFDVWLSKDKIPVIMHDGNVARTTDGEGHLREKTLAEIKELDAGKRFNVNFTGERVPTLRETLKVLTRDPKMALGVEIKEYTFETVDLTISMIHEFNCFDRCTFYCFNARIIKYLKQKYNAATMGYPSVQMQEFEDDTYRHYDGIGISMKLMTPELCDQFKKMNLPMHMYCAENEADVIRSIECGAISITANDPVPMMKVLESRKIKG